MSNEQPIIPDYQGACISNVVPELIKHLMGAPAATWMPTLEGAKQVVLLVLDGLGWNQLQAHRAMAPVLTSFDGGRINCVAPSSTAPGLTSIVTGRPPAVHGIAGYRLAVGDHLLDVLKWSTEDGADAREVIDPVKFQVQPAFAANNVPVVSRKFFAGTGFTSAMFRNISINGYSALSGLPVEVWRLAKEGHQFIYAYYEGLDTVAHAHGLGEHYDAELYTCDRLVRDLLAGLPEGCALVVTSDHGQVQVGGRNFVLDDDVKALCTRYSGEGRFRWLHATPGNVDVLEKLCKERFSELAWVMTRQEAIDTGMFGGELPDWVALRLGDVALIAREPVAFRDPTHDRETQMQCRHGSLTEDEMFVPLLSKVVGGAN